MEGQNLITEIKGLEKRLNVEAFFYLRVANHDYIVRGDRSQHPIPTCNEFTLPLATKPYRERSIDRSIETDIWIQEKGRRVEMSPQLRRNPDDFSFEAAGLVVTIDPRPKP